MILPAVPLVIRRYRNDLTDRNPTEIEPGVVVGGVPSRARWKRLRDSGVDYALRVCLENPPDPWMSHAEALIWIPTPDRLAPTIDQMRVAAAFIDHARARGGGVMMYCGSGIGRAPTTYLAWPLQRSGEAIGDALGALRRARPCVSPTEAQLHALSQWVRETAVASPLDRTQL